MRFEMLLTITWIAYTIIIVIVAIGFITICRAASCIIRSYEREYGKVKWKWLFFINKYAEQATEAAWELEDLEQEVKQASSHNWDEKP